MTEEKNEIIVGKEGKRTGPKSAVGGLNAGFASDAPEAPLRTILCPPDILINLFETVVPSCQNSEKSRSINKEENQEIVTHVRRVYPNSPDGLTSTPPTLLSW